VAKCPGDEAKKEEFPSVSDELGNVAVYLLWEIREHWTA
jgi:hypothetical protein